MNPTRGRRPPGVVVCYLTGLDLRRVDHTHAPFLRECLDRYSWSSVTTFPSSELTTTILTGTYPARHGSWHATLAHDPPFPRSWVDRLPDTPVTTIQGLLRVAQPSSDYLATIPPRRLRRLGFRRYKYGPRGRARDDLLQVGGIPTIFSVVGLGEGAARYVFNGKLGEAAHLADQLVTDRHRLEFLESRALDVLQHWELDRPEQIIAGYRKFDELIRRLHERCSRNDARLVVISDHGHELVTGSIDLHGTVTAAGMSDDAYTSFVEPSLARFWFHDDEARKRLGPLFRSLDRVTVLTLDDLHRMHLEFPDHRYGELFLSPDPGVIFFPHDFYQPVANLFLGLSDPRFRSRIRDPRLRGDHGYLPDHPSERGFVVGLDDQLRMSRPEIELIDLAPSLLWLLDIDPPGHMTGRVIWQSDHAIERDRRDPIIP